jgi:hypothetical protein
VESQLGGRGKERAIKRPEPVNRWDWYILIRFFQGLSDEMARMPQGKAT